MAALAEQLLLLLCTVTAAVALGQHGRCDCTRVVARQHQEIARLRAEVRALRSGSGCQRQAAVASRRAEAETSSDVGDLPDEPPIVEDPPDPVEPPGGEGPQAPGSCEDLLQLASDEDVLAVADLGCRTLSSLEITSTVSSLVGLGNLESVGILIITSRAPSLAGLEHLRSVGTLEISGNGELISLAALSSLESVSDYLVIKTNAKLTSLLGLEGLQTVGGVQIQDNAKLSSLAGLEHVESVSHLTILLNSVLLSLSGLRGLRTAEALTIGHNHELRSLAGLENLTNVSGGIQIEANPQLTSITALRSLHTAGSLTITGNPALGSLAGLENLTSLAEWLVIKDSQFPSLAGLEGLKTVGSLSIEDNRQPLPGPPGLDDSVDGAPGHVMLPGLGSLAGLENLVGVGDAISIKNNEGLSSLSGLQSLRSVGSIHIRGNALDSFAGLENLTVVEKELQISFSTVRSLEGLGSLSSTGLLLLMGNGYLQSLVGLESLVDAWGGVIIEACTSLRSLQGLGALTRSAKLSVTNSGRMEALGAPLARGASVNKIVFDETSWPRCITSHERDVLAAAVGATEVSTVPDATWQRWSDNSCGGGYFECTKGRACSFLYGGNAASSLFISGRHGGCGACSGHRPQSAVAGNGVVDFGHLLASEEAGRHSVCRCSSESGPVGELLLRGARQSAQPTVCTRGSNCTLEIDGEGVGPEDSVVVASSCTGANVSRSRFAPIRTAENVYLLHGATWYAAAATRYAVCWRAPCTFTLDGHTCLAEEENSYFEVGSVELYGAYTRNYSLVLGQSFSVPNFGFGVSDRDRMRLSRSCGQDGPAVHNVNSSGMVFDFGPLTADLVESGSYHLCWCQAGEGAECGEEQQFMAESGEVKILCPAGQGPASTGRCLACPPGRHQAKTGLEPCAECPVGHFSLEGAVSCEPCHGETFAELPGSPACAACRAWETADADAAGCSIDPAALVAPALLFIFIGALCAMLVQVVKLRLLVADVSVLEGQTIVSTCGSHGLSDVRARSFPVTFHGTGHPGLDKPLQPFHVTIRDAVRLELLTAQGEPVTTSLDTSMGTLAVAFPYSLYHKGWPVPLAFSLPLVLITVMALAVAVLASDMAVVGLIGGAAVALLSTAAAGAVRARPQSTPLRQRLAAFKIELNLQLRRAKRTSDRGPHRALEIGKLHNLLHFFSDFIRDRTAYYLCSCILRPLTESARVSYAELVGAGEVEWFVSHYWGTAFEHFCTALRKHAEMVCGDRSWGSVRYWVCFCSNNQHQISEELGKSWKESSFYLTLQSGLCRGTCMVLDDQALPLTRIWCIFELLQTITLERRDEDFQGLLLCTSSGVLNMGSGSVDVAMALANKVANMDLATARATSKKDEDMIRTHVVEELGSFSELNRFTRQAVRNMIVRARRNSNQQFDAVLTTLDQEGNGGRQKEDQEEREEDGVASV